MKLTVCLPYLNQLNDTKGCIGCLKYNTSEETEWMIIDNGSRENIEQFFTKFIKPKRMNYIRNDENVGMIETMQQAYNNCETDVLVVIHNDVFVFEKDWDKRILSYFEKMPDLGAFSFFGAQGCGPVGERIQDVPMPGMMAGYSNMLEAEIHGIRLDEPWRAVAIFDGLCMGFRMDMLRKGNGFDMRYKYHHIYDRDIALESLKRGYKNIVVNIPCHHLSGLTANRSDYQNWINKQTGNESGDKFTHDDNSKIFASKWKNVLPLYVESDFSFRIGQQGQWDFKGDKIVNYNLGNIEKD